ncbi:hypothetical protein GCM10027053_51610 [Intrasporangium mesophilum]
MPRFHPGQLVVTPGGTFAIVTDVSDKNVVRVRREGDARQAVAWLDMTQSRAEALRSSLRLLTRLAEDVGAYRLVDLAAELAPHVEHAAQLCDLSDALKEQAA